MGRRGRRPQTNRQRLPREEGAQGSKDGVLRGDGKVQNSALWWGRVVTHRVASSRVLHSGGLSLLIGEMSKQSKAGARSGRPAGLEWWGEGAVLTLRVCG